MSDSESKAMQTPNETDEALPTGGASSSSNPLSADERRMAGWLSFLIFWLFLITILGGTVRITHSGLSIPEWPIIYYGPEKTKPSVFPPLSERAWEVVHETYHREVIDLGVHGDPRSMSKFKQEFWLEYGHRFVVAVFSIMFLAILVQTFRKPVLRRRIAKLLIGAAVVLFAQIVLGGIVVKTHTPSLSVSYHLCMAFIFTAMVAWAALRLTRPEDSVSPSRAPRLTWWALAAAILCLLQIFSGGLVANTQAGYSYNTWPLMAERLIPPMNAMWQDHYDPAIRNLVENRILVQWTHRWFAFVVAGLVFYLMFRLVGLPLTKGGRWTLRATVFVLGFQILLGIITLLEGVPVILGVLHLGTGLALFLLLVMLTFEVRHNAAIAELQSAPAEESNEDVNAEPARIS